MRKIVVTVIAAAAGLGLSHAAFAADLGTAPMYTKAGPAPFTWAGSYVGAFVGGATGAENLTTTVPNVAGVPLFAGPGVSYKAGSSFIGGYEGGYNWQVSPNWVLGYESETGYINLRSSAAFAGAPAQTAFTRANDFYSVWSARVGYAVDRSLFYAKGGVALARFDTGVVGPGVFTAGHKYDVGYAAGGGWEYAFAPKWSVKAEYLYLGFDDNVTRGNGGQVSTTNLAGIHTGKVGLNYKFDPLAYLLGR